jgi:hypothetical protein
MYRHVFVKGGSRERFAVSACGQAIELRANGRTVAEALPVAMWQGRGSAPDAIVEFNGDIKLPLC